MGNRQKPGRGFKYHKALYRNLISALILRGKIKTTAAKAAALQPKVDILINQAKTADRRQRDQVAQVLASNAEEKLFHELLPQLDSRTGGYTRIVKMGPRKGDRSKMTLLELIVKQDLPDREKKERQKSKAVTKKTVSKKEEGKTKPANDKRAKEKASRRKSK